MSTQANAPGAEKRILIVLLGAIGDVTRALPLAVRIKKFWPASRVTWAVEPMSRSLVERHPSIDRVVVFKRGGGLGAYQDFIRELRQEPYDLALDLQRHLKSGVTSFLSRGKERVGFHWRNAKEFNWLWNNRQIPWGVEISPKIRQYQKFGDYLGLPPLEPLEFGLHSSAEEKEHIESLLQDEANAKGFDLKGGMAAIVCGVTWESRRWPLEHYRELINHLARDRHLVSVLIGGPAELSFAAQIGNGDISFINLIGKTSLHELCAVFERCRFVVGPDTGPAHIAAACKVPVITLWGATSPRRSAPYGSEKLVLQTAIGCSPCYLRQCPGLATMCMSGITPEAVLARVHEIEAHGS